MSEFKKLAVVGSRIDEKTPEQIEESNRIRKVVNKILDRFYNKYTPTHFISGKARGIDSFGEFWADQKGLKKEIFVPNWYPNGRDKPIDKGAGFRRNKLIIEAADYILAFTLGSNGTKNSIDWAKRLKKPLVVFDLNGKVIDKENI